MNRLEKIALCLTVSLTLQLASYPQEKKSTKAATTTSAPDASAAPGFGDSQAAARIRLVRRYSSQTKVDSHDVV